MRVVAVAAWAVGVFAVGLCQYPTMWVWIPGLIGLVVGGVQTFALPRERQWAWIGVTPVVFGLGSLPALLAAAFLGGDSRFTTAMGGTQVSVLGLLLSWLFTALVTGYAQRALYRHWRPPDARAQPAAEPVNGTPSNSAPRITAAAARRPDGAPSSAGRPRSGWGRKVLWSFAIALVSGVLVAGALTAMELSHPSSETAALGIALAFGLGIATALVVLVGSLVGVAIHAWLSR